MSVEIKPVTTISGTIEAPPSKAHTLRAIILASLAKGSSVISRALLAEDQRYAIAAMQKLGAQIDVDENNHTLFIQGVDGDLQLPAEPLFVGNSGVTIRLLAALVALIKTPGEVILDGDERMRSGRPIEDLLLALSKLGVKTRCLGRPGCPPLAVTTHTFLGGKTELRGDKSSQYFSAILVAAPYAQKNVTIETIDELNSKPYIDITLSSMQDFGVFAQHDQYRKFSINAAQGYQGRELNIEGDYSNAAYFMGACAICGGRITIGGLRSNSAQGDKFFVQAMEKMGCLVNWQNNELHFSSSGQLKALGAVRMNDYPDIVMPLAVVAAFADGQTTINNVAHLKYKESDRLAVTVKELQKLGIDADCDESSLTVRGCNQAAYHGAVISGNNDHRIVMSFAMAGLKIPGVLIEGEEAVNKSYPEFFTNLKKITH
ncbi:MAG: 3-phosphoshikimate 1-carboxyvinyltransferase [Deltaproteobacteria bacterium]|nr:3-phosphoshikimate 1-carboxyvinyltransferase [Deltaproteobacteria bacterium]